MSDAELLIVLGGAALLIVATCFSSLRRRRRYRGDYWLPNGRKFAVHQRFYLFNRTQPIRPSLIYRSAPISRRPTTGSEILLIRAWDSGRAGPSIGDQHVSKLIIGISRALAMCCCWSPTPRLMH